MLGGGEEKTVFCVMDESEKGEVGGIPKAACPRGLNSTSSSDFWQWLAGLLGTWPPGAGVPGLGGEYPTFGRESWCLECLDFQRCGMALGA